MRLPITKGYLYDEKIGEIELSEEIVNNMRSDVRYELMLSYDATTGTPVGFTLVPIPHRNPIL